ncbi:MAG: peptidylprolyl isomerase [Candidatus Marinimicrobia bacterium]|jgi:peptidyl-prolyl cis-trans isomerase SurA|nr:peptidylprolyl isomerase [Candidatus Neomarinimicrobiota bacterium]
MKKTIKIFTIITILTSIVFSQQLVDGIAAIVGEKIILSSEVQQMTFELAQNQGINLATDQSQYETLYNKSLRELINMDIIQLQAEVDSVYAKERDVKTTVDNQIEQYTTQLGSKEKVEAYFNMPLKKIKENLYERVESSMIVQKMQANKFQDISVTRPEVIQYYNEHKDSIPQIPERVDISHILIIPKPSKSHNTETRKKLLQIKEDILNNKFSFSDAAKEYSQDPGSANQGGNFGFIPKGTFVKDFEKAAFSLKEGEISDVVETEFGLHIIKLIEKRGENTNVSHILLKVEAGEEDNKNTINMLSTIKDSIINGGDFDKFALKYSDDTDVKDNKGHLGEFPINTLQIESFQDIVKDLSEGEISKPFQSKYGYHILKLNSRKPAENIKLDTHYNVLENMVTNQKRQVAWNEWLNDLYSKFYVDIK